MVMDPRDDAVYNAHYRCDQYYPITYTFTDPPNTYIDLLNVTIDYRDDGNALSNLDDYEFWFAVHPSGSSKRTVRLAGSSGKFVIYLPD